MDTEWKILDYGCGAGSTGANLILTIVKAYYSKLFSVEISNKQVSCTFLSSFTFFLFVLLYSDFTCFDNAPAIIKIIHVTLQRSFPTDASGSERAQIHSCHTKLRVWYLPAVGRFKKMIQVYECRFINQPHFHYEHMDWNRSFCLGLKMFGFLGIRSVYSELGTKGRRPLKMYSRLVWRRLDFKSLNCPRIHTIMSFQMLTHLLVKKSIIT